MEDVFVHMTIIQVMPSGNAIAQGDNVRYHVPTWVVSYFKVQIGDGLLACSKLTSANLESVVSVREYYPAPERTWDRPLATTSTTMPPRLSGICWPG